MDERGQLPDDRYEEGTRSPTSRALSQGIEEIPTVPQQSDQPQQAVYGQPPQPHYPPQQQPQQGTGYDYSPGNPPIYGQQGQPAQPPQYGGGDYRPEQQPQYGGGDYYPSAAATTIAMGGPPAVAPKKKGMPVWVWLVPLVIVVAGCWGLRHVGCIWQHKRKPQQTLALPPQPSLRLTPLPRRRPRATSTAIAAKAASATALASGSGNADLLKAAAANMKAAKSYHIDLEANQASQDIKKWQATLISPTTSPGWI